MSDEVEDLETPAETEQGEKPAESEKPVDPTERIAELEALVAERTEDLQRLQAEYANYKKRVDRDRSQARKSGIEAVLADLIPVMDSILAAETAGDLKGGFKLTADELAKVANRYGFEHYGAPGDEFDPQLHEALMQQPVPGDGDMYIKDVLQAGYQLNGQVTRPARVIVAVPDGSGETQPDDETSTGADEIPSAEAGSEADQQAAGQETGDTAEQQDRATDEK